MRKIEEVKVAIENATQKGITTRVYAPFNEDEMVLIREFASKYVLQNTSNVDCSKFISLIFTPEIIKVDDSDEDLLRKFFDVSE